MLELVRFISSASATCERPRESRASTNRSDLNPGVPLRMFLLPAPRCRGLICWIVARCLRYGRRPEEEVLCDVFAAECLLPYDFFARQVVDRNISLDTVKSLAEEYKASLTATGSRFALNANEPCAFVLSEDGRTRYVSRSKYLSELKGWINFNVPVPQGSVAIA